MCNEIDRKGCEEPRKGKCWERFTDQQKWRLRVIIEKIKKRMFRKNVPNMNKYLIRQKVVA